MDIPLIQIEVTPDIAFKIRAMAEMGVFSLDTGNITLNFHEGRLKSAKTESYQQVQAIDTVHTGIILK